MSSTPDLPDYRTPSPDEGHEAIRKPLEKAIDDLARTVADVQANTIGVDDAYFLADTLFELVGAALTAVDDLTARVAVLEAAATPTEPTPEVSP